MDAQLAETNLVAPQKQQSEDEEETFKTAAGSVVIAWLCPSRIGSGTFVHFFNRNVEEKTCLSSHEHIINLKL